jgi:heterodisulfide reductase subunit C
MEIDVAKLMESIRIASKKEGRKPAVKEVPRFSEIFLDSVKAHGRTYELGLTIKHNMANGTPLKDAELGPNMFLNGKLSLLPPKIKNKERIKKIFEKSDFFEPREKKDKGHH